VAQEKRYLLFALRRLLSGRSPEDAQAALAATAARLDHLLFGPLALPPATPIVVVPTGLLHGLPWSTLPTMVGRAATIAPSAAVWLGDPHPGAHPGEPQPERPGPPAKPGPPAPPEPAKRVLLVAGPGLPGADAEVLQLSVLYPEATVLTGPAATTGAVLAALEQADVAHVAAHGNFRSDSPLFSSLLLADGQLTVYDLERLRAVPSTVVLAACDAAVAAVRTGDEPLGTAATLLSLGVQSVIAPVIAVPDGSTVEIMVALHQRLGTGDRPSAALAHAAGAVSPAAGSPFVCMGRNDAPAGTGPRSGSRP
jgi:hypothetical protein